MIRKIINKIFYKPKFEYACVLYEFILVKDGMIKKNFYTRKYEYIPMKEIKKENVPMIFLLTSKKILMKKVDYKLCYQYKLDDNHERYLMCLANRKNNTKEEIKKFVYGEKSKKIFNYVVDFEINEIIKKYDLKIKKSTKGYCLEEEIYVGD